MARHEPIYRAAVVRTPQRGRRRHLFRGTGMGYPTSLCGDAQGTPTSEDVAGSTWCPECHLIAVTELALAASSLGLADAAIALAKAAREQSYETPATQRSA